VTRPDLRYQFECLSSDSRRQAERSEARWAATSSKVLAVARLELEPVPGDAPGMDGSGVVRPKPGVNCPRNGGLLYAFNCPARIEIPDKGGVKWRNLGLELHPVQ
jgi:hypothetical protein